MNKYVSPVVKNLSKKELWEFLNKDIDTSDADTAIFCFLFISCVERQTTKILKSLVKSIIKEGNRNPLMDNWVDMIIDKHSLSPKIEILGDTNREATKFHGKFLKNLIDIRNSISHGNFTNLKYKTLLISETSTKQMMFDDLIDSLHKIYSSEDKPGNKSPFKTK